MILFLLLFVHARLGATMQVNIDPLNDLTDGVQDI